MPLPSSSVSTPASSDRIPPKWLIVLLVVVVLVMRVGYSLTMRFDNDEPQHLHVVWGWTQGLLPYKDIFDNHAPLFQWLSAPLLRLIGERPDIVIPMRWAMLPIFFAGVYLVYRAGRAVLPPAQAFWAAMLGSLIPRGFLKSVEYRPDDLWAVLWFAFLAVVVSGRLQPRRAFVAGVILGVAFAVSLKTTLMLLAIGASLLVIGLLRCFVGKERLDVVAGLRIGAAALGGMVIAPLLVAAYFYFHGALLPSQNGMQSLWYCMIEHNIIPGMKRWSKAPYTDPWLWVLFAVLVAGAVLIYRQKEDAALRHRRLLLFLAPGFYLLLLYGMWPDITREDDPPFYPLIPLALFSLGAPLLAVAREKLPAALRVAAPWAAWACLVCWLVAIEQPWDRLNRRQIATLATALRLTSPEEYVMDAKCGAVFRRRPYYFVIESITRTRIRRGWIKDDVGKRLEATKTTVADSAGLVDGSKARGFIAANYLPLTSQHSLGVAGKCIATAPVPAGQSVAFRVAIATRYSVIDPDGGVPGTIDGAPFDKSQELAVGEHVFVPESPTSGPMLIVLAKALELGYRPELPKIKVQATVENTTPDS